MAHERDEDSKDVKAGTMIKDMNEPIVTVVYVAVVHTFKSTWADGFHFPICFVPICKGGGDWGLTR